MIIKKRVIISFILTVVGVALLNKLWNVKVASHCYIFQPELFIILSVLILLLSYKIADCVADFKTLKGKSRIDILFLTVFFVFLLVPMSYINQDELSPKEYKTLSKWKPLINDNKGLNYRFGKDFESWFNDRFNLRYNFIYCYKRINYMISSRTYNFDNHFYFNKKLKTGFYHAWNYRALSQNMGNFDKEIENIKKLKQFCAKNNIKLYVLIAPTKGDIYPEVIKDVVIPKKHNGTLFKEKINDDIVIFPINEIKEAATKDYVFPKCDPHWSEYGAFIGYKALMKRIKKDYNNLKILSENDFAIIRSSKVMTDVGEFYWDGYFCNQLSIKDNQKYPTYIYKNKQNLQVLSNDDKLLRTKTKMNNANKFKIYLLGNSFSEYIWRYLRYSFSDSVKIRYNSLTGSTFSMSRFEKDILDEKPDILIISIYTGTIEAFKDLYY